MFSRMLQLRWIRLRGEDRSQVQPLVFLHLPKTAGLSLRETILEQMAGCRQFRIIDPVRDFCVLESMPETDRRRIDLVEGHLYYGVHELIGRPCRYVTMLRDPVERVLSWYSFVREYTPHHLHDRVAGGGEAMSLAEAMRCGLSVELDNHMVRMLAGQQYVNVPFGGVTAAMLHEARSNLETFAAVGLTEQFDDSLALFARTFGWRCLKAHRINQTKAKLRRDECDPGLLELVRSHNLLDQELYECAVDIFERQKLARRR